MDDFEWLGVFDIFKLFGVSISEKKCVIVIIEDVDRDSFEARTDEIFQTYARN